MFQLIEKLLPVVIIIGLGILLREKKIINLTVIEGLKQIITKIALPAVFFLSFLKLSLQIEYMIIVVLVFVMCSVLYIIGVLANKRLFSIFKEKFSPGFFTGFELGMVGIGLFTALWGTAFLPVIMLIGLGHEVFIWFVYVPLLEYRNTKSFNIKGTIKSFVRSPIIIAIMLGLIMNVTGIYARVADVFWMVSIVQTLTLLSQLTSPLMLIVIGYFMAIREIQLKKVMQYVILRAASVALAGGFTLFLIHKLVDTLDPMFNIAFIFFLMLPPPYILPLFIKDNKKEAELFSQMLVCYTFISFIGYIILMLISL